MTDVARFYDALAPHYHLLYGDWESAVARQGAALARLLDSHGVRAGEPVLDAACGIGTQTFGLLAKGYAVTASDCSPGAIDRLRNELHKRELHGDACVDDLRSLGHAATGAFSAVIACDNSIPHLLSDADLLACFHGCFRCLRPGGLAVFSVRDYAAIQRVSPDVRPYAVRDIDEGRFLAVQVWDWDGDHYDLRIYLTLERPDGSCRTEVVRSRYYAVTIDRLLALMQEAGFVGTQRLDDVLFQPVLIGQRPRVGQQPVAGRT
jgi:SAM-dependent methyltransferase